MTTGAGGSDHAGSAGRYEGGLAELVEAWHARDEARFFAKIDAIAASRDDALLQDIGELTRGIRGALERFCADARLEDLTNREVPDARVRLEHVLALTNEAAHRTMDLVERSCIPAEHTRRLADELVSSWHRVRGQVLPGHDTGEVVVAVDAFLQSARDNAEQIRGNLSEVLLAQGYQDLSGQIIRSVMNLIEEIQITLAGLVSLSRGQAIECRGPGTRTDDAARGPRIPGLAQGNMVCAQDDVDILLSGIDP